MVFSQLKVFTIGTIFNTDHTLLNCLVLQIQDIRRLDAISKNRNKMANQQKSTFIKTDKKFIKLNFDDILFITGLGNYVEIFVKNNKKYMYYKSLKVLIDKLPDEFMRVHNSNIVNFKNVEYIEDNHLIIGEHRITIAKSYKDCLFNVIDKLLL